MYKFSTRSLKNLIGVHPDLVTVMMASIPDSPVDFTITCGVRTTKEQLALYAQGRTLPGKIVTRADGLHIKSNHQTKKDGYGYAVDLYPYRNGQVDVNDSAGLKKIAAHVKSIAKSHEIAVTWGGDWKMLDLPHFELSIK
jgi:peptidoglycan L-alanyl-D-glutamate endopeptidase CwlK